MLMRFSFLKTLFLCLIKEFLFLFWSHLGCYASDVGHKFFWVHSFWWGVGWSVRWGGCRQGSGSGSLLFFWTIFADMPCLVASTLPSPTHSEQIRADSEWNPSGMVGMVRIWSE